jgi:hypothetical protein
MPDFNDTPGVLLSTTNGHYYGTEKGGSWLKRYRQDGWFMRGNSVIWVTPEGIFFRRYLTKRIMHLPIESIQKIEIGSGHAGKWSGNSTLKITWRKEGENLVSGFVVARSLGETEAWASVIRGLIGKNDEGD